MNDQIKHKYLSDNDERYLAPQFPINMNSNKLYENDSRKRKFNEWLINTIGLGQNFDLFIAN